MYSKILVPIDLHEESSWKQALPMANQQRDVFNAELHILYVLPAIQPSVAPFVTQVISREEMLKKIEAELADFVKTQNLDGANVNAKVVVGRSVYQSILRYRDEIGADLIVMSSHRPQASDYLLGPNSARVVRHANCSVFVVRDA